MDVNKPAGNGSLEQGEGVVAGEAPYSVLPHAEKAFVIVVGSFAAVISPLSSSIYLPSLDSLARDMDVSVSLINLTITTYLVRLPISQPLRPPASESANPQLSVDLPGTSTILCWELL